MAAKMSLMLCVLAIWVVVLAHGASSSGHNAPAPSADCSNLILSMADCLSFVTNGSTTKKPEGNCCSGLKTVLKSNPACLCQGFKNSAQLGVALNVTKAMTLPAVCKVSAPSFTNCGLSEVPAAAPASSGGMSPTSSPTSSASAPGMSGSGAASELSPASAPAPSSGSSASSLLPISAGSLLVCLALTILSGF